MDADLGLYRRAKEIFDTAVALEGDERNAHLDRACSGDDVLRAYVARLLASDARATRGTLAPAAALAGFVGELDLSGRTLGQYRIVRKLGAGGMGVVYEAEQQKPRRPVALKVMRYAVASEEARRRFSYEVEILGRLRHPGIAQVYEAGTLEIAEQSVPFFAMEFVASARRVTDYARERRLSIRERIALFAKVCDAIQHGHQSGVIHRDLKPDNILVDGAGEAKVIDFGVARSTNSDLTLTTQHTHVGELLGTLAYMSPEQCEADPTAIDSRTDVYSLGVVLYELLCDRMPYDVNGVSLIAASRVIREQLPERPSALARALKGDLEAIVLTMLDKKRGRRYATAEAAARDLRRFLAGERVDARTPRPMDLLAGWIRRRPVAATASLCALLVLLTGSSMALGAWFAGGTPARLSMDREKRQVTLESRLGFQLDQWDTGVTNGAVFAQLIDRPKRLGGGKLALIAAHTSSTWGFGGELCAFDAASPHELLWSTASSPVEFFGKTASPADAKFGVSLVHVANVFPESPEPELVVVHTRVGFSEATVRVFDLSGQLLYQTWNDGTVWTLTWLSGPGLLVAGSADCERQLDQMGVNVSESFARYPATVFAVKPRKGWINRERFVVRDGSSRDDTLAWYRWLGPAAGLPPLGGVEVHVDTEAGNLDPAIHCRAIFCALQEVQDKPRPSLIFLLDEHGQVVSKHYGDDEWQRRQRLSAFPAPGDYDLYPYEALDLGSHR